MPATATPLLARARRGVGRQFRELRDRLEWHTAHALQGASPWCRNRWGHRYRAISLAEYHYLRDGNPETYEAALLERTLRPGMTIVDVGANHGLFSLEAAHFVGESGRIHAFEPAPATRPLLQENLAANDLDGLVRVFPHALGAVPGVARLRVHHELSGLNTLAPEDITWNHARLHADEVVEVPVRRLDDHAAEHRLEAIDFLKIDVEGYELSVLRGASGLLESRAVRRIMLEVGDVTCANAHVEPGEILEFLGDVGYTLHPITERGELGERLARFPAGPFSANFLAMPAGGAA
jgi:FkbM family methyltransferase